MRGTRMYLLDRYYRFYKKSPERECYYCGWPAFTVDHVPNLQEVHRLGKAYFDKRRIPLLLVTCCEECNSILAHSKEHTLTERRKKVEKSLRKRYGRYLDTPDWSEDELSEMSYSMRQHIESSLGMKRMAQLRIAWAKLGPNFADS